MATTTTFQKESLIVVKSMLGEDRTRPVFGFWRLFWHLELPSSMLASL